MLFKFSLRWKPMAWSERTQEASRKRLLCDSDYIIPGHGKVGRQAPLIKFAKPLDIPRD